MARRNNKILILVEVDFYDESSSSIKVLRLSNLGYSTIIDGVRVLYQNRLTNFPIQIGNGISGEQYGQALHSTTNGGTIEFLIDEGFWPWLNYHVIGRSFRIYQGFENQIYSDLELIYIGRITNLGFSTTSGQKVTLSTTDASLDFNKPLVSDLYPDTALAAIVGKPKPYIRGEVYSVAPILEDDVNQVYRLANEIELNDVMELRVGGVPWTKVVGVPGAGEWSEDLSDGTIQLGSVTLNGEVRCDVRVVGYDSYNRGFD